MQNESGQSLIELIVVTAVAVIVVGALTFATIASLRNASFAKNQSQATKLAQDGLERMRGIRDRDSEIQADIEDVNKFSDLWGKFLSHEHCNAGRENGPCFFKFADGVLTQINTPADAEGVDLKRHVEIFDRSTCDSLTECYTYQKQVTVVVSWIDFSGPHKSRLTTILRNPNK